MGEQPTTKRTPALQGLFLQIGLVYRSSCCVLQGPGKNCNYLQIHFLSRHVQDTVVMVEESNHPQTRCLVCVMIVPW